MIINCCFMLMRLHNRTVASLGVHSMHTGVPRSSRYKVFIKNQKTASKKKKFVVWKGMQIKDLVKSMDMSGEDVMDALSRVAKFDQMLSYSMEIHDMSILSNVAKLCGGLIEEKKIEKPSEFIDKDVYSRNIFENPERLRPRPPVVTIMGHVDHGKTTLLDSLRSSRIVDSEFGGITQHIGAFKVKLSDISSSSVSGGGSVNDTVTFLDTPGHAAFSAMRARGANCTDIVILVVAIDDGLMPQTLESIRFAREAKVPLIVVINKVDRVCNCVDDLKSPRVQRLLEPVMQDLSRHGVLVEECGGDVQCIPVSALRGWNLDLLQESILALAEVRGVLCDHEGSCEGVVLEARSAEHHGKVATVLVRQGRLQTGAIILAGSSFARVRSMRSDAGVTVTTANPGDPVEVAGWRGSLPMAGDLVLEVATETRAKEALQARKARHDAERTERDHERYSATMHSYRERYRAYVDDGVKKGFRLSSERPQLEEFVADGEPALPKVTVVVKADVQGSLEALVDVLAVAAAGCADQCTLTVALAGVGALSDSEADLAAHADAVVYLFNVPPPPQTLAIDVRRFAVIYHLFDDLRDLITTKLPRKPSSEVLGEAQVLKIFEVRERRVQVAVGGCRCTSGQLLRVGEGLFYRVLRPAADCPDQLEVAHEGLQCKSLRHLRADVDSVRRGVECGLILTDQAGQVVALSPGDVVRCCKTVYLEQRLKWTLGFQ